jgi:hypothetical protein
MRYNTMGSNPSLNNHVSTQNAAVAIADTSSMAHGVGHNLCMGLRSGHGMVIDSSNNTAYRTAYNTIPSAEYNGVENSIGNGYGEMVGQQPHPMGPSSSFGATQGFGFSVLQYPHYSQEPGIWNSDYGK